MAIWGRCRGKVEKIDDEDSVYLLREYQMAFGAGWTLWRGRKKDEPREAA
jgi:hypothetical protein